MTGRVTARFSQKNST